MQEYGDVLCKNMGMFYVRTSGCFDIKHGDVLDLKLCSKDMLK